MNIYIVLYTILICYAPFRLYMAIQSTNRDKINSLFEYCVNNFKPVELNSRIILEHVFCYRYLEWFFMVSLLLTTEKILSETRCVHLCFWIAVLVALLGYKVYNFAKWYHLASDNKEISKLKPGKVCIKRYRLYYNYVEFETKTCVVCFKINKDYGIGRYEVRNH